MTRWWVDAMHRKLSYHWVVGTEAEHMQDFWANHRSDKDRCIECGYELAAIPLKDRFATPCPGCGYDGGPEGNYIEPGFRGSFDKKRDYRRKP